MPSRKAIDPLIPAIGEALRAERERLGWSQEELCDRAGLDRTYLSGVERGVRYPNLRSLLRLTRAMRVSLSKVVFAAESRL